MEMYGVPPPSLVLAKVSRLFDLGKGMLCKVLKAETLHAKSSKQRRSGRGERGAVVWEISSSMAGCVEGLCQLCCASNCLRMRHLLPPSEAPGLDRCEATALDNGSARKWE